MEWKMSNVILINPYVDKVYISSLNSKVMKCLQRKVLSVYCILFILICTVHSLPVYHTGKLHSKTMNVEGISYYLSCIARVGSLMRRNISASLLLPWGLQLKQYWLYIVIIGVFDIFGIKYICTYNASQKPVNQFLTHVYLSGLVMKMLCKLMNRQRYNSHNFSWHILQLGVTALIFTSNIDKQWIYIKYIMKIKT